MWGKKCVFKVFGKKIILDGKTFGYAGEIYVRKCYFPSSEFQINSDMTVMDLGAANGVFTVLASLLGKQVISIEIKKNLVEEIKKNAAMNNCLDKINIIWGAIGYKNGITVRELCQESPKLEFPKLEFKEILVENKLKYIDFLKVDIEGSEFDLFQRDNNWLSKIKLIAMEVHPQYGNPKDIKNILENKGYKVMLMDLNKKEVFNITDTAGGYLFAKNLNA